MAAELPASRKLEVKYEDLVSNVEQELARICQFIGTHYDQKMLDYHMASIYDAPDPARTEQWRTKLTWRIAVQLPYGRVKRGIMAGKNRLDHARIK